MPTYEYACQSCDHEFEQFQSMNDEPLKKCPKCGKKRLKRLVGGGAGLIFKGTGFYITDYKKKTGGEPKAGEAKTGESKPSGESKSSGESKPAGESKSADASKSASATPVASAPAKPAASAAKK